MWYNSNFLNIHQIKNENMKPDAKMSGQDDVYKIFEFRPFSVTFLSKKL